MKIRRITARFGRISRRLDESRQNRANFQENWSEFQEDSPDHGKIGSNFKKIRRITARLRAIS
jgi:hypothetical protein